MAQALTPAQKYTKALENVRVAQMAAEQTAVKLTMAKATLKIAEHNLRMACESADLEFLQDRAHTKRESHSGSNSSF